MPDPSKGSIGRSIIAFTWAFYYLKNEFQYEVAIKDILLRGGDTDTNAAIVGGLLGAGGIHLIN
jgi:ADP-ribosyl-[dinitrogen reductase] hydrolase